MKARTFTLLALHNAISVLVSSIVAAAAARFHTQEQSLPAASKRQTEQSFPLQQQLEKVLNMVRQASKQVTKGTVCNPAL